MNQIFLSQKYAVKHKSFTFASVFHGIRFKVRRLFVGMTSNFFLYLSVPSTPLSNNLPSSPPDRRIYCNIFFKLSKTI